MKGYKQAVGQYINIYGGEGIDAYIVLCESEDEVTPDKVERATEIIADYCRRSVIKRDDIEAELADLFPWGVVEIFIRKRGKMICME